MEEAEIKKPKWLKKLEQESWQAELLISSAAIYAAFQLPELINRLSNWAVTYFSFEDAYWNYVLIMYLSFAVVMLIVSFVTHLILRTIWIALIGLNSVFPDGINPEGGTYSKYYMEKFIADVQIKPNNIHQLDNFCSGIFAFCAVMTLTFLVFSFDIAVVFFLKKILEQFVPAIILTGILYLLGGIIMLLPLLMLYVNTEKNKKNEQLQHNAYKAYRFITIPMMHVFYQPMAYVGSIFTSNIELKRYWKSLFFSFIVLQILVVTYFIKPIKLQLSAKHIHSDYERTDRLLPNCYETNLLSEDDIILSAVIEREQISGPLMKVFVPIFPNEEKKIDEVCGIYEAPDSLERAERHQLSRTFYLDCYQQYHQFYVNDSLYQADILKFEHPHRSTDGIITYLPTDHFNKGKNMLTVKKVHPDSTLVYRTMNVPFWFAK